jgi:hypothetical protein
MTNSQQPIQQEGETGVAKEDEGGIMMALERGLEEIKTKAGRSTSRRPT